MSSHDEAIEKDWTALYVLGELPEPERERFEEHLFDCPACSGKVKTGFLLLRGVEATFHRPIGGTVEEPARVPVPQRKASRRAWPRPMLLLPYAALVLLSVGTGVEYAGLRKAQSPQPVVSFAIPPQARGITHEIQLPRDGQFVELELDLLEQAPQYRWSIRSAGAGALVMSGEASRPENASALRLLLPVHKLHPGRYEALLTPHSGQETVYPFEVTEARR